MTDAHITHEHSQTHHTSIYEHMILLITQKHSDADTYAITPPTHIHTFHNHRSREHQKMKANTAKKNERARNRKKKYSKRYSVR